MTFALRDYQQRLVDQSLTALRQRETPVVVLPTGGGKTVVIAELVKHLAEKNQRILLTAHRIEIIQQIAASIAKHTGIEPGLAISGSKLNWTDHQVVVGMVPTLTRRLDSLPEGWCLIEDECHHAIASSWQKLREALNPIARLGLTATPITPSGGGLAPAGFTRLIEGPTVSELIKAGALCKPRYLAAPPEQTIDTTGTAIVRGDYDLGSIEQHLDGAKIAADALALYRQHAPDTKAIVAAMSCRHAQLVANQFNQAGIHAAYLDGQMAPAERERAMAAFRSGQIQILCQMALIDEGFDVPAAETLLLLRPTRSLRLHRQLVGRVMRPAPAKTTCTVIDAGSAYADCGLPTDPVGWTLGGIADHRPQPTQQLKNGELQEHPRAKEIIQQQLRVEAITAEQAKRARLEKAQENLRTVLSMYRNRRLYPGAVYQTLAKHPRSLREFQMAGEALGRVETWAQSEFQKQNQALVKRGIEPAPETWPRPEPVYGAPLVGTSAQLAEVWAAALQACELPSTRMLLASQCSLGALNGDQAQVVAAPAWHGMAAKRKDAIAHALSTALGRKISAQVLSR